MASTVGMIIKISADTKRASDALNRIDGQMNSFSRNLKSIGFAIAGAFSVSVIADFAKEALLLGSAFEQAEGAASQLFGGPAAKQATEWAQTTAENLGLSAAKALEAQNAMGAFALQAGLAGEDAVAFTQDMVTAAADMAAAFGGDVATAVDALGSAFRGQYNPLERYGVVLTAAAVNAEAAALGFEKVGASFSTQAQMLARTSLIEKQMQLLNIQGQNAREAETFAGASMRLAAAGEDLKLAFGQGLLSGLTSFGAKSGEAAQALKNLQPLVQRVGKELGGLGNDVLRVAGLLTRFASELEGTNTAGLKLPSWMGTAVSRLNQMINPFEKVVVSVGWLEEKLYGAADAATAHFEASAALTRGYAAQARQVSTLGSEYDKAAARAAAFYDTVGAKVLYNTVAAQVKGYGDVRRAAEEAEKAGERAGGGAAKAAEEAKKKVHDLALEWQYLGVEVDVARKKADESLVEGYNTQLDNLRNAAKAYTQTVREAIAETQREVDEYRGKLNETFLGVDLEDFILKDKKTGVTMFDSAAFQQWLGDKEAIRSALAPVLDQIPQAWAEQLLDMDNDAALATLNWITNSEDEVAELQKNMNELAVRTEETLTGPMSEAMRSTFWEAQAAGIEAAKAKVKEEAQEFKKYVRSKLNTKVTVDVVYNYINPPGGGGSPQSAVRQVQQFEALNGRSWRV